MSGHVQSCESLEEDGNSGVVCAIDEVFDVQVVQLFDSWAHVLSPHQFAEFSLPYAQRLIDGVRAKRPRTPLIFHANGGKPSPDHCNQCLSI